MGNQWQCLKPTSYNESGFLGQNQQLNNQLTSKPDLLSPQVLQYIQKEKPFQDKIDAIEDIYSKGTTIYQVKTESSHNITGFGRAMREDRSVVYADFVDGKANGKGLWIYEDGSTYEGQIVDDQLTGEGRYQSESLQYRGSFLQNYFHGEGEFKNKDTEEHFKGCLHQNLYKKGVLTWFDLSQEGVKKQSLYEGEFEQGEFHGQGLLKNNFGIYEGQFKNGVKEGHGKFKFQNGLMYVGDYKNDKRHGKGIIYNSPKEKQHLFSEDEKLISYRGQFKNDMPHGKGEVQDGKGKFINAVYSDGINKQSNVYKNAKMQSSVLENSQLMNPPPPQ